jgi:hypothetical protein
MLHQLRERAKGGRDHIFTALFELLRLNLMFEAYFAGQNSLE